METAGAAAAREPERDDERDSGVGRVTAGMVQTFGGSALQMVARLSRAEREYRLSG